MWSERRIVRHSKHPSAQCYAKRLCTIAAVMRLVRGSVFGVLTWLSCCAAPGSAGMVIQVVESEVPIEL